MISDPGHGLRFGGLQLVENGKPKVHAAGFITEVSADGTTWGNPEAVVVGILTMLRDGALEETTSYGNRRPVIFVRVKAPNGAALQEGENALSREAGRPTELIWQPPDVGAPPTVWEIVNSYMDFSFDHQAELRRTRTYQLTLSALPWGRSAVAVTTPALPAAGTTTVTIDTMDATTGWTATTTGTDVITSFVSSSGALHVMIDPGYTGDHTVTLLRTGASIDLAATRYLRVEYSPSHFTIADVSIAGGSLTKVREVPTSNGRRYAYYDRGSITPTTTTTIQLTFTGYSPATTDPIHVNVYQLDRTDTTATGTGRQGSRSVTPTGGVAAEGDVTVEKAGTALGQTIVYSRPASSAHAVALRPYRTSGSTETGDATKISGTRSALGTTAEVYDIPADVCPRGNVHVWATLGSNLGAGTARINFTAAAMQGTTVISGSQQSGYAYVNIPTAGSSDAYTLTPYLRPIARLALHPALVEGPNAKVRLTFAKDASSSGVAPIYDEIWLFEVDTGRLTVLDLATGTPAAASIPSRVKITAPNLIEPYGAIRLATAADFSDAWSPTPAEAVVDNAAHRFDVGDAEVFVVTGNAQNPDVSFRHYPRGHTHAPVV